MDTSGSLTRRGSQVLNLGRTVLSRAGLDRRYSKVFAIGFNKTATTSIDKVFKDVGIRSVHNVKWRTAKPYLGHYLAQAFSDGPPEDFRSLDRRFPNSKFILNVRDLDEWLDSRLEHVRYRMDKDAPTITGTWTHSDASLQAWVRERNAHHLDVLEHFSTRPDDLLVINYIRDPTAAERLTEFLGSDRRVEKKYSRPIPKTRTAGRLRNPEMIQRNLTALGIPEVEWTYDLYCPSLEPAGLQDRWPGDTGTGTAV